ncbi:hypothetical protein JHK84_041258 [Glycine max]|nr:hypothetical protein JHK84_041258 [Glycine max]
MAVPQQLRCYYFNVSRGFHLHVIGSGSSNVLSSQALHQTVSIHSQSQAPFNFNFNFNLDDPTLPKFLELLKKVTHSSQQALGLHLSGFQANRDLICSAIWVLREEWKPALLAFKWSCHGNDEKVCNLMIWVLATHGKFSTAWCIIRDMHRSSLSTRQAMLIMIDSYMISCFSKEGNLFDSLRLYDQMKKRGWIPGIEIYNSLVYVLTHENCLKEALRTIDRLKEQGLQPGSVTFNSMILSLCEAGKLAEARIIFNSMVEENVSPTTETYHAFFEGTDYQGTLEFLTRMKDSGLGPSKDSFVIILAKFLKLKQPVNAPKFWTEMKTYDVLPSCVHYRIMVEGLVTCRWFIKARGFYEEMISNGCSADPMLNRLFQEEVLGSGDKGKQNVKKAHSNKSVKYSEK